MPGAVVDVVATACDEFAVRGPEPNAPCFVQQLALGDLFKLMPKLQRTAQERHVIRMFEIAHTKRARLAVRCAEVVGDVKLIKGEHRRPAPSELITSRGPHGPNAKHDHIKSIGHEYNLHLPSGTGVSPVRAVDQLIARARRPCHQDASDLKG